VFVAVGGGSIGLLAGGVLTQFLSWHWIFFVNVPIGIATLILGRFLIVENVGLGIKQGVDWLGSALITVSVMVAIYGVVTATTYGWVSAHTLGVIGVAVALFVFFMVLESRLANPIMPLRILKLRTLTGTAAIRGLLITGMFSTFFIGALYFEHVLGYSPVKTGVAFLPQAVVMAIMSTGITAKLVNRFGAKPVMYPAMILAAIGLVLLASAGQHANYFPQIFIAFVLLGVGAGASFMPLLQIGMSEVPKDDAGLGSGVVNVSQQMAGAIGLAVLSTIAANRTKSLIAGGHTAIHSLTLGYQLALYIAAGCVLAGLLVSPILLRSDESPEEQAAHMAENMQNPETKEHLIL
jgi:MFS family permease